MYRNMIGASSALAILALLGGVPATVYAHEDGRLCNVILDGDGEPVLEDDGDDIAHSNSSACADGEGAAAEVENADADQKTAAVSETPAPAATIEPLIIYFDTAKDQIDAGARAEVDAYVAELKATSAKSLAVVGFTDTSGPADLNARLSEARANSVSEALIEAGLPADMITRGASGEDELAIATPDDTREANNRRVTVTPIY